MKKLKYLLILASVCAALMLCGCSEDELAMYDLLSESYNAEQYTITGIHGDNYSKIESNGNLTDTHVSSDVTYTIEVNQSDSNNFYRHIILDGTLVGFSTIPEKPIEIIEYGNKTYLNKDYYEYVYNYLSKEIGSGDDLVFEALKNGELMDVEYIFTDDLPITPDVGSLGSHIGMEAVLNPTITRLGINNAVLYGNPPLRKLFADGHSGFETGYVSKTENGYRFDYGLDTGNLNIDLWKYEIQRPDEIYAAYTEYNNSLKSAEENHTPLRAERYALYHGVKTIPESLFYEYLNPIYYGETERYAGAEQPTQRTIVTTQITDAGYKNTYSEMIWGSGENLAQEYCEDNITPSSVEVFVPENAITLEELNRLASNVREKINPYVRLRFEEDNYAKPSSLIEIDIDGKTFWSASNGSWLDVYKVRQNGYTTPYLDFIPDDGTSNSTISIYDKNGNIYVPFRPTAEFFGETVVWNETTQTAAIKRNDEIIPVNGVLYHPVYKNEDQYYFRLRDFEKLGYKVEYIELNPENGSFRIEITKP